MLGSVNMTSSKFSNITKKRGDKSMLDNTTVSMQATSPIRIDQIIKEERELE